jgi:hypothetical protein
MRFGGRAFHVDQAAYQSFFDRVLEFMKRQGLRVEMETRPPAVRTPSSPPSVGSDLLVWASLVALAVFGAMLAYLIFSGRLKL